MALVVSSTPLAALWAQTEPSAMPDERRPVERASSSSSSSRRLSNGSSNADTCESSSGNSFGTQRSNSSSNASALHTAPSKNQKKKAKQKRSRLPDVVIHVQDCSFAVHMSEIRRKCRVLHSFLLRLRVQNAVGDLAEADLDDAEPIPLYSVSGIVTGEAPSGEQAPKVFTKGGFVLRQRNPLTTPRGSTTQPHRQRCPVLPKQHLSDRAAPTASSKSTRFPKVCCIAHQKGDDEVEAQRPRSAAEKEFQRDEYSPGKENYVATLSSSTVRPRPLSRIALAPKMPFMAASSSKLGPRGTVVPAVNSLAVASTPSSQDSSDSSSSTRVAPDALDVELVGATADAVATLIEFIYSGKTSGINESNAAVVTRLCKWFSLENHLFYNALIVRARSMHSVGQWIDILLQCTNLRCEIKKKKVIDYLLGRLIGLPTTEFATVMQQMPIQRLAAIEDPDILARVMVCMVNHLRHIEIWKRLTYALELWQHWTYHIPYIVPSYDHGRQLPGDNPMSLLAFHHRFVSWQPVYNLQGIEISGIDAYVDATTLLTIGPYVVQVRFEPKGKPLILWRVVRAGTPADAQEDARSHFQPERETAFTIRGRLNLVYKLATKGPVLQEEVVVRYTHTKEAYGKWQVLLSAPSSRTKAYTEPESEEKTHEPDSSQEEEVAPNDDSDAEATEVFPTLPVATGQSDGSHDESSPFEPMTTRFSGQLFTWGHRLCNLYHFMLVTTLFYQVPDDSPIELRLEASLARMRELPVETLLLVLECDRLRVPGGETTLASTLATLCLSDFATMRYSLDQIRALFCCVRWTFVDLEQIMSILEHSRPELKMYELVEQQLHAAGARGGFERRAPWGVDAKETPYRSTTTLIEFQIEAGDRSLSPVSTCIRRNNPDGGTG